MNVLAGVNHEKTIDDLSILEIVNLMSIDIASVYDICCLRYTQPTNGYRKPNTKFKTNN